MSDKTFNPENTGRNFIEYTKYPFLPLSPQRQGSPLPLLELAADPGLPHIELPDPDSEAAALPADLHTTINERISIRNYRNEKISLGMLSLLLWETQGVKENIKGIHTLRTVPSAGARHALETWLLINRVEGLTPGLYRFLPLSHSLVQQNTDKDMDDRFTHACNDQLMVKHSAVTFIWSAEIYRIKWRYSERAYRYIFLDAGHVCQNLYLSAQAMGCGVCSIASFDDDMLNELLGLDGESQFAIYGASVGLRH